MAEKALCAIPDCGKRHYAKGWCNKHYCRWRSTGKLTVKTAKAGTKATYIEALLQLNGYPAECIRWPFALGSRGYGYASFRGVQSTAHRQILTAFRGTPPNPKHEAAHNCGNRWCVNPTHLRWATAKENQADRVRHGTAMANEECPTAVLTNDDVREIRLLAASRKTKQAAIAKRFGVSPATISMIVNRKTWVALGD